MLNWSLTCAILSTGLIMFLPPGKCLTLIHVSLGLRRYAMSVYFSLIFMIAGIFFLETITAATGADSTVFDMTYIYMKIMLLFSPAFIFNDVFVCFIRNDGSPNLVMVGMIAGSFANIIMDYIFIYPLNKGILGAVLATGVSPIISMLILSRHIIRNTTSDLHIYTFFQRGC